jgi:hypothetical protein
MKEKQTNKQTKKPNQHYTQFFLFNFLFSICKKERERAKHATNNNETHTKQK